MQGKVQSDVQNVIFTKDDSFWGIIIGALECDSYSCYPFNKNHHSLLHVTISKYNVCS